MARDARILDGSGNPILDGNGNPIYDGGPFEIEVHDCGETDDFGPGQERSKQ
jgi:hypothetical protein